MGKIFCVLSIFVCLSIAAFSQTEPVRPSVSVIGEANLEISPDQVVFTFEVVTADRQVAVSKQANDTAAARTLAAAKSFNISADDIQTDSLTISPKYTGEKDPRGAHVLLGYEVTKRILITLKDLNKIDVFLARVIEAGVNKVVDISIENSQYQKYQEEARAKAVTNARDKATNYAKQLNQTVGKAYVIREEGADDPAYFNRGYGSGNGDGDGADNLDSPALTLPTAFGQPITFALGKIKIEEKIYVTFELNR
jgi:uncharacterized protein YggE